ncbi:MAG: hypothetical protein WC673_00415 [Candidatus Paceibacterota bacterium]|jgi:hypothetical protein
MDGNFQKSFIPRESLGGEVSFGSRPSLGSFTLIAIVIFLISAGAFGVTYLYKQSIKKNIAQLDIELARMQEIFQPATVAEFEKLSSRLAAANKLVDNHIALSKIFDVLEEATLKSVYFSSFSLTSSGGEFSLGLGGVAKNFSSVALQSDAFRINPAFTISTFSNLNLDEKGNVVFGVAALVDPKILSYKHNIAQTDQ